MALVEGAAPTPQWTFFELVHNIRIVVDVRNYSYDMIDCDVYVYIYIYKVCLKTPVYLPNGTWMGENSENLWIVGSRNPATGWYPKMFAKVGCT